MGTAYLTPIPPTIYTTDTDCTVIYAVHPPVSFGSSESTPYVLVASSYLVGDTVVHPCDAQGDVIGWDLLARVPVADHLVALRVVGYELEVIPRGA